MFENIVDTILEALKLPFQFLLNPEKRIYFLYLLSSIIMAYYVHRKSKIKTSFSSYLFSKKTWWSSSAQTDYLLIFFNAFVKILLIGPYVILGLYLAYYVNEYLVQTFGSIGQSYSKFWLLLGYTITLTILIDFASFIIHYTMHKIPLLWEFHKIHHSATTLSPITQYRLHPIELIINNIKAIFVFGLVTGIFDYLADQRIDKLTFIGVNIFSFVFLILGSNLRHSHVKFTYFNILEYLFISPFQHQIHHSNKVEHYDKNMGSKLAIWDWMFGTLLRSEEVDEIHFGLGEEDQHYDSFWKNLYKPFTRLLSIKRKNDI